MFNIIILLVCATHKVYVLTYFVTEVRMIFPI